MTRRIWIRCFVTLKIPKKKIWSKEEIGFRVNSWFWADFLCFWGLRMGWTWLWECFLGIWGRKLVYRWQTPGTLIFWPLHWPESGYTKRRVIYWGRGHVVFFFFRLNWGERAPLCYKKSSCDWAWRCRPSCGPFSHGPNTRLGLIICFFLFKTLFICS
jgi:hypothetical protein